MDTHVLALDGSLRVHNNLLHATVMVQSNGIQDKTKQLMDITKNKNKSVIYAVIIK